MKNRSFVCVDVDGTLLDFQEAIKSFLESKGVIYKKENCNSYSFDGDIGCSKKDVYDAFYEAEFYKHLYAFNDALMSLEKLQEEYITSAYTASVVSADVYKQRCEFIKRHNMPGVPYIGKKPVIKEAKALFDDCLEIHKQWIEQGYEGELFLIDAPYNREESNKGLDIPWDRVHRCSSFSEAVNQFLGMGVC